MSDHGYCAHSRTAAGSVRGLLRRFAGEVAAHLAAGRCPRPGARRSDPFAPGSPERVAIEAAAVTGVFFLFLLHSRSACWPRCRSFRTGRAHASSVSARQRPRS